MKALKDDDGSLQGMGNGRVDVQRCTAILGESLARRDMQ